jgi:hypothetical protein
MAQKLKNMANQKVPTREKRLSGSKYWILHLNAKDLNG